MNDAIAKADVLVEALAWIRRFRDKAMVIKLGGSLLEDPAALRHLLVDIVFIETVGMHPVVVHGGGAAISRAMEQAGLQPRFIRGRRYTDDATLEIVERVLAYETNRQIAARIEEYGGQAKPLNFRTKNVLFGRRLALTGDDGRPVDLGHVGEITRVDRETIETLCEADVVPVIPSMCIGPDGEKLNVNADTVATAVAEALQAEKLVFLSDVNGVRKDKSDPESLIHSISARRAKSLMSNGAIEAGMIPKIEAGLATLEHGVGKVHIIDGRLRHSLLLEIYTNTGVGTEIVKEEPPADA